MPSKIRSIASRAIMALKSSLNYFQVNASCSFSHFLSTNNFIMQHVLGLWDKELLHKKPQKKVCDVMKRDVKSFIRTCWKYFFIIFIEIFSM